VLLDTSGLLCFLHQDEAQHKTAVELISNYKSIEDLSNSVYKEFDTRKETAEYFLQQKYPKLLFSMLDKKDFSDIIWKLVKPNYFCPFSQEEKNET
jgi:RNA ligase